MIRIKRSKLVIVVITIIILLGLMALYAGITINHKKWHFVVHNKLNFLLEKEFRELLNSYGKENNFASYEKKNAVGIIVTYPLENTTDYSIQLRLEKDLMSRKLSFKAEVSSPYKKKHFDTGNPPVYIDIPMEFFGNIIEKGLTQRQINILIETADGAGWETIELDTEIKMKPTIVLPYIAE
jgi:hypothetical protein